MYLVPYQYQYENTEGVFLTHCFDLENRVMYFYVIFYYTVY